MVQQLTSEGNIRSRVVNYSPNGDIAITTCTFFLTLIKYYVNIFILVGVIPYFTHSFLHAVIISSMSFS